MWVPPPPRGIGLKTFCSVTCKNMQAQKIMFEYDYIIHVRPDHFVCFGTVVCAAHWKWRGAGFGIPQMEFGVRKFCFLVDAPKKFSRNQENCPNRTLNLKTFIQPHCYIPYQHNPISKLITAYFQARSQGGAGCMMHPPKSAKRSTFSHIKG